MITTKIKLESLITNTSSLLSMNLFKKIFLSFKKYSPELITKLATDKDLVALQHIFQKSNYEQRLDFIRVIGKSENPESIRLLFHCINDSVRIIAWEVIAILSDKQLSKHQYAIIKKKIEELHAADENEKNWPKGKPKMGYNLLSSGFKKAPSERMSETFNTQKEMNQPAFMKNAAF